jgi:hypothetical protein
MPVEDESNDLGRPFFQFGSIGGFLFGLGLCFPGSCHCDLGRSLSIHPAYD